MRHIDHINAKNEKSSENNFPVPLFATWFQKFNIIVFLLTVNDYKDAPVCNCPEGFI